ncbi:MAG: FAD-dependent oxidoreductase [Candidatus Electrothrix sp. GW3-4]|uniref:NAD(P)/FAD-dependent oxidoreductase n=1 Tax=Candidatus Electrothrix sp. GW3-4 TaxID=3126740 RepID=UPI0030D0F560
MSKRLVIAGGGHAHMLTLAHLEDFVAKGFEVTVIGPDSHHYYSGMGPGMLGGTYRPEEIRFATQQLVENKGGLFIQAKVTGIQPLERAVRLSSGEEVPYDVLSCNLGSQVPADLIKGPLEDIFLVKPIERLFKARQRILELGAKQRIRIAVVGGGPSAVEIAGNIWRLGQEPGMQEPAITVFAGRSLMPHHSPGVRQRAVASLAARSIKVISNTRVQQIHQRQLFDSEGITHKFDIIFVAVGVQPNRLIGESGIPTGPQGGMLVNRYLQSIKHTRIFGGGDCIDFQDRPLDKVGVYAVRQNPILRHNLMAALTGERMQAFAPGGKYLLIFNLGDGTGILSKWSMVLGGRLAFFIKDWIDRRFMRTFQAFE